MTSGAEEVRFRNGDVEIAAWQQGSGPPVLLLHGFPELAYSWRHQFEPLAKAGFQVVAPDQRGFGDSSRPERVEDYDIERLASDAAAILDAVGGPAVVIGHDWGAPVAWHTALRYPDKVRAVGSLSVPHARRGSSPPLEAMRAAAGPEFIHYIDYFQTPGLAEAEFESDVRSSLLGFLWSISGDAPREERFRPIPRGGRFIDSFRAPSSLPSWLSEQDLGVYVEAFRKTGFRGGLNWYRNVDRNWQLTADLAGAVVKQPAFFITGSRDPARNPAAIERLPELVPNLRLSRVLEGCGHWTQQERPHEVNACLVEFLRSLSDDSSTM
jgi:pimeloyl-ACP methyl ester carboxylesterase